MTRFRVASTSALLAAGLMALSLLPAKAQTPSIINPPYNNDLGAVVTNTLRTPSIVSSEQQSNLNWKGVTCTLKETLSSGTPSTTFSIQEYEQATNTYRTLLTSSAVTGSTDNQTLSIYPGIQTSSLPSLHAALSWHLPRFWRVVQTVGSGAGASSPATTSKIGCNYLN